MGEGLDCGGRSLSSSLPDSTSFCTLAGSLSSRDTPETCFSFEGFGSPSFLSFSCFGESAFGVLSSFCCFESVSYTHLTMPTKA